MRYAFPCDIVLDDEERIATGREAYGVTFPDVYGANTCGWSWEEALYMAEDCLGVALGFYVDTDKDIPAPSPLREGQVLIPVPLLVAAKLTIYTAMREQGITRADMAARLGMQEDAVRKLLDTMYRSHLSHLERALKVLGKALVVEDAAGIPTRSELVAAR